MTFNTGSSAEGESIYRFAVSRALEDAQPPPPLEWLDMSNWDNEPIPERQWAIRDRTPANQAGIFSGEGGTGKSIIELMKNVAHVGAKDWLGSLPEPGPAIYVGAEDDKDEIHIRIAAILDHCGMTFKGAVDGGLHILPLLGKDATLCTPNRSGRIETTPLYQQLYEAAGDIKPRNISIDTLSRAFAGSEIDRAQVYQFATHMQALALVTDGGSVTVLSHPSLAGIASGTGLSGSTGWQGAFRFHFYLNSSVKSEDEADNNTRLMQFRKKQYGPLSEPIVLSYQRGLFLPVVGTSSIEKAAREARVDELFVHLLKQRNIQNRNVSEAKNANNYAPTVFSEEPEARRDRLSKKEFEAAMQRLFKSEKIQNENYGKPSRERCRLVVK